MDSHVITAGAFAGSLRKGSASAKFVADELKRIEKDSRRSTPGRALASMPRWHRSSAPCAGKRSYLAIEFAPVPEHTARGARDRGIAVAARMQPECDPRTVCAHRIDRAVADEHGNLWRCAERVERQVQGRRVRLAPAAGVGTHDDGKAPVNPSDSSSRLAMRSLRLVQTARRAPSRTCRRTQISAPV